MLRYEFSESFGAPNLVSSLFHPKHDLEGIRSRNPTGVSMR